MTVRISTRAREDLEYVYALIHARQGSQAADRFLDTARDAVRFLAEHPHAGPHPHWTSRHKQIRFWVISRTRFIIYYFAEQDSISVERVLDGRRNVKRIIDTHQEHPDEDA
jgi:plasmid stabilization system protein ParE